MPLVVLSRLRLTSMTEALLLTLTVPRALMVEVPVAVVPLAGAAKVTVGAEV
jgi:hypothetical protein